MIYKHQEVLLYGQVCENKGDKHQTGACIPGVDHRADNDDGHEWSDQGDV